jgi:hypothetical protein
MLPFALLLFVIVGGTVVIVVDLRRDARRWNGDEPSHLLSAEREDDR